MTLKNTLQSWVTIGVAVFAIIKKLRFRKLLLRNHTISVTNKKEGNQDFWLNH